jgi:hypothetical protein
MDVKIERVSVHRLRARQERDPQSGYVLVTPYLEQCDLAFRVSVRVRSMKIASRLAKAIEAGAALTEISVQKDLFGEEYLASKLHVAMASINADLTRLGY